MNKGTRSTALRTNFAQIYGSQEPTMLPPEEPTGEVIGEETYTARLGVHKELLTTARQSTPFEVLVALRDRLQVLRGDVFTTYHNTAEPSDKQWFDRMQALQNLIDETAILDDLDKRFDEWIAMFDEILNDLPKTSEQGGEEQ